MASLLDWQKAGVALKVEVTRTTQLVYAESTLDLSPFTPGGPADDNGGNFPVTWYDDRANGISGKSGNMVNSVASGVWTTRYATITATLSPRLGSTDLGGAANRIYSLSLNLRQTAAMDDTQYVVRLAEVNPSTQEAVTLVQATAPIADPAFSLLTITAPRAIRYAEGFTMLRITLGGHNYISAGSRKWGMDYANVKLSSRDTNLSMQWHDITCDVKDMTIRYGRERFTERFDIGTLALTLANDDGEYSYAKPHPFNFGPGRAVRVTATYQSGTYPLAWGIIDQCNDGLAVDGRAVTAVQCLDPSSIVAGMNVPTIPSTAGLGAASRIGKLLDLTGFPFRNLDTNVAGWGMQQINASGRTVRDEMGITSDSEGGALYADRDGTITYKNRNWYASDVNTAQVTATFNARPASAESMIPNDGIPTQVGAPAYCPASLVTEWGMSRVVNDLTLANAGGAAQRWEVLDSIRDNGRREYQRTDFVLQSSSLLPTRANDILTGNDQPKLRLNRVSYRPDLLGHSWVWTLRGFLGWLVRVWYQNAKTGWGWIIVTHVQSVEHRITPTEWETVLALDEPISYTDAPIMLQAVWDGAPPAQGWDVSLWS